MDVCACGTYTGSLHRAWLDCKRDGHFIFTGICRIFHPLDSTCPLGAIQFGYRTLALSTSSNKIIRYSAPETDHTLKEWHEIASVDHFWFQWRQRVLFKNFGYAIREASRIADIGCGKCMTISEINRIFNKPVDGFDLNDEVLSQALPINGKTILYNFFEKNADFKGHYDLILLLDVLEHLEDDENFLKTLAWHLADNGRLLINVPANQRLFSKYDEAVGHWRRYDINSLRTVLEKSGYRIISFINWGCIFAPLVWVRKKLAANQRPEDVVRKGIGTGRLMNQLLRIYSYLDVPSRLSIPGTSVTVLVEKK